MSNKNQCKNCQLPLRPTDGEYCEECKAIRDALDEREYDDS